MHDLERIQYQVSAADTPNIDSAGAVSEFRFAGPVIITKVGVTVTTAVDPDNSVALTATLTRRPVTGSASNAVTLGVFTMKAANSANTAAGSVIFKRCHIDDADGETAEDGTLRNEAPNSNISANYSGADAWLIQPGQSFAMTLDASAEADSGAVYSWVEYIQLPWNGTPVTRTVIAEDVSNVA